MDYSKGLAVTAAAAPTAATLAHTGSNSIWMAIAAVGMVGLGSALYRFVPRKEN